MGRIITALCGGTGGSSIVEALCFYTELSSDVKVNAVVGVSDSGGPNALYEGHTRGRISLSDMRALLVAASPPSIECDLMAFRFSDGPMTGFSLGNLSLNALIDLYGIEKALQIQQVKLGTRAVIHPITYSYCSLGLEYVDGQVIAEEHHFDDPEFLQQELGPEPPEVKQVLIFPSRRQANVSVLDLLARSDVVVVAPGDFYTSIGVLFAFGGVREAIASNPTAYWIHIANRMNKFGQTDHQPLSWHVQQIEQMAGRSMDRILFDRSVLDDQVLEPYLKEQSTPVQFNMHGDSRIYCGEFITTQPLNGKKSNKAIRHAPQALGEAFTNILATLS